MRLPLWIAGRYLRARPRTGFLRLLTAISIAGVAVGVTALLVVLAVMNGFEGEVQSRIAGTDAHVVLLGSTTDGVVEGPALAARLARESGVLGASAFTYAKAMVFHAGLSEGLVVKGVDLLHEREVTNVSHSIAPALDSIPDVTLSGEPGIVLGAELAAKLAAGIGDRVLLATLQGDVSSAFGYAPKLRPFRVVGLFTSGLYTYDSSLGFTSVGASQRFFELGDRVTGVEVRLADMFAVRAAARAIVERLGEGYLTTDWIQMNESLFSALWLEKTAIAITIGLIVMVAALNIIASLILLVMEKSRDIAILKTMGASSGRIRTIFMLQGLIIGLVGTAVGATLGCALIYVLDRYRLIHVPLDVYQISYVPFTLQPLDFVIVIIAAVVICFLATLYPSRQAARLDPAQALRYE